MSGDEPFGALAPSAAQDAARRLAERLPANYFGRKAASLLLGPAGGRESRAYDVEIFGSQKARLHPTDNICEKRVYLTPQLWDAEERALLAAAIDGQQDHFFYFVDVGANAGLYTLFARARCEQSGVRLRALCIEPDPEMRARLAFNVAASDASGDVSLLPYAATGQDGPVRFAVNVASRGLSRVDESGGLNVDGRTLLSVLTEAGAHRVDAMKIDIEGGEFEALDAFFRVAPETLWPRLLILETSHESPERSANALARAVGYEERLQTKRNFVGVRRERSSRPDNDP